MLWVEGVLSNELKVGVNKSKEYREQQLVLSGVRGSASHNTNAGQYAANSEQFQDYVNMELDNASCGVPRMQVNLKAML